MSINQITQIRLSNGKTVALTDWSARPLYSAVDLLSGFTDEEIRCFNYTESQNVSASGNFTAAQRRVASLRDTNVSGGQEMDSTEEYLVYSIAVEIQQYSLSGDDIIVDTAGQPVPTAPALAQLHNRLVLELEVSQKAFPQAGLGWFVTGFGPQVAVSSTAAVRTYANSGSPQHTAKDSMPIPVHLGGTEDYTVILHNPPNGPDQTGNGAVNIIDDAGADVAAAVMMLRVYLCGLHKRPTG